MNPSTRALSDAAKLFPRVLQRALISLILIHLARSISSELFSFGSSYIQGRGREDLTLIIAAALVQFVFELFWGSLWSLTAIRATRDVLRGSNPSESATPASAQENFQLLNQLLIENVRGLAAVLYRAPLLILPAVLELVRLVFVPEVVLLDPDYDAGRVDALTRSRELTRGHWTALIATGLINLALSTLVTEMAQGSIEGWMWLRPHLFLLAVTITFFITLGYEIFLVQFYMRLVTREDS